MKNIIICCDGTNNQLETNPTNVLRLFKSLLDDPYNQVIYYDPGVGTMAQPGRTTWIGKKLSLAFGLAFGVGFTRNLEGAYRFLMDNYNPGDKVFMFGFSRGAYTVRALAGMLHMFGLLDIAQKNLLPYLSRAYIAANFAVGDRVKAFSRQGVSVHFLGLWDTVTSLGFAYKRKALPFTTNNEIVRAVRQALAIDERRAYFRQNRWGRAFEQQQDIKEVWFAGVHSDIGGGYPEGLPAEGRAADRSGLSKITLQWMVEEARRAGILIDQTKYETALRGHFGNFVPDAGARANESLTGPWWILEFLPMNYTLRRRDFFVPLARRRRIEANAIVHQSVVDRMKTGAYDPPNLSSLGPPESWSGDPGVPSMLTVDPSAKFWEGLKAGAWLIVAAYVLIFAFALALALFLKVNWSLSWARVVLSAIEWPGYAIAWLGRPSHLWVVLLLAVPLAVFLLGSWTIGKLSRLSDFASRVYGKLLHLRWQGYDKVLAEQQLKYLLEDGREAYVRMLKIDLGFPIVYGPALIWGLQQAVVQAGHIIPPWIAFVPVVTMISDWVENFVLLRQVRRYSPNSGLDGTAIRVASTGTIVKIISFTVSLLTLVSLSFLSLWKA